VALHGETQAVRLNGDELEDMILTPEQAGLERQPVAAIVGGVAGEGAGAAPGFGTVAATMTADASFVLAAASRGVSDTAMHYGFDPNDPREKLFILSVINVGSAMTQGAKYTALADLSKLTQALARGAPWVKLNEFVLARIAAKFAKEVGVRLTKQKLGLLVPFVGIGVAASLNYATVTRIQEAAYWAYRERLLLEKRPEVADLLQEGLDGLEAPDHELDAEPVIEVLELLEAETEGTMSGTTSMNVPPRKTPAGPVEQVGDWSGVLPREDKQTSQHRRAQGVWRSTRLQWPAGPPLTEPAIAKYPTLPNYLAEKHNGMSAEDAGVNLMSSAARMYAIDRLPLVKALSGAAEPKRLYRNLLSSQPLAFSIAGEFRANPAAAVETLRRLTGRPIASLEVVSGSDSVVPDEYRRQHGYQPLESYTLAGIEAEWFPPRWAHTDDRSGFDIAACAGLSGGDRLLVSVEVKYTDSFSSKPLVTWDRYEDQLAAIGLDEPTTKQLVKSGCSQVLRQVMITASVGRIGLFPGVGEEGRVQEVLAVVLAREDDQKAKDVVDALDDTVSTRVAFWSHVDLFRAAAQQAKLAEWAAAMTERYIPVS